MEEKKYSIKETKEVLGFIFSLAMAYDKAKADGKVGLADGALIIDPLMKAMPAFDKINEVGREMQDLDDAEKAELNAYIASEFNIADDAIEAKIEQGLAVLAPLISFVLNFKK